MTDYPRVLSFASAAVLALALGQQPALAAQPVAAPAPPAPAATPAAPAVAAPPAPAAAPAVAAPPAPAAAPSPQDAARVKADAERNKRYEELRARAAEVGLDLPATPPWANAGADVPQRPAMPFQRGGMTNEDMQAMRAEHQAMREKMKNMSPEERKALREEHWKEMRARAAERGVEMPETPPWVEAEQRYKAAQERFEQYRKTVEAMTEEQREAAKAVFGGGPEGMEPMGPMPTMPPPMRMPRGGGYGPGPQGGGYPGFGPYPGGPGPMGQPPMPSDGGGMMGQEPPPPPPPPQGN